MSEQAMESGLVTRIRNNPKYQELVAKRSRFAWTLSIIMLIIYYAFILVLAFAPASLGTKLGAGTVMSVGIPVGVIIILSAFVLTGIYVKRANSEFDELTRQIKEEVK